MHPTASSRPFLASRTTSPSLKADEMTDTIRSSLELLLQQLIPKLRRGSFFPSLLERRRRVDRALYAVAMEAYVHGISTRKVDDLVQAAARGLSGTGPRGR
jgi:hypothetical protein